MTYNQPPTPPHKHNTLDLVSALTLTSSVIFTLVSANPVSAIVITGLEVGNDVVFSFEGEIDLATSGFTIISDDSFDSSFQSQGSSIYWISGSEEGYSIYSGSFTSSPTNFGSNTNPVFANSSTGSAFGVQSGLNSFLSVPVGHTNGTISGTSTYNSSTFASLGLTEGSYVWGFGGGQSITLNIGGSPTPVPEPVTILGTLLAGGLGFAFKKKHK